MANGTDGRLNVVISANVNDLKKGLTQAERGIKKFDTSTKKMTGSTKKMTGGLVKGAVPAMTSFSQVVQDAPFGIRGVANNIQQLTMQMGHLSANAGGTKNALKAMVKSLAGPAGILLAVSIVTSLMVSFGDTLFSTTKKADKLAKAQEKLAKSLEDYEASLKNIDKAQLKGSKSAAKELTTLRLLAAQIENTNLSTEKRVEAIDDLRKQYPSYLQGITDESVLANGLISIYDKLADKILKKAKAQAAASLITDNVKKELIFQSQLDAQLEKTSAKRIALAVSEGKKTGEIITIGTKLFSEKDIAAAAVNDSLKEETKIQEQIIGLQKESLKLANFISEQGGIVPLSFKIPKGDDGITRNLATGIEAATKGMDLTIQPNLKIDLAATSVTQIFSDLEIAMMEGLIRFNESAKQLIEGSITETFAGLGEAIGTALSEGGDVFGAIGQSILMGIGGFLKDFGKLMIQYGVTALAFSQATKALLNPITAGPAAVALIATGVALTAVGSAISSFAKGGSSSGGDLGTDFSGGTRRSGSSISGSGGGFSGGTVVFEIAGTKLVGVIDNTLRRNRSLGGSNNLLLS